MLSSYVIKKEFSIESTTNTSSQCTGKLLPVNLCRCHYFELWNSCTHYISSKGLSYVLCSYKCTLDCICDNFIKFSIYVLIQLSVIYSILSLCMYVCIPKFPYHDHK